MSKPSSKKKESIRDHCCDADGRVADATPTPESSDAHTEQVSQWNNPAAIVAALVSGGDLPAGYVFSKHERHALIEAYEILRRFADSVDSLRLSAAAQDASEKIRKILRIFGTQIDD